MKRAIRVNDIKKKLREIEDNISIIEENLPENFSEFSSLGLIKDGIYKKAEFAIENVIDICNIINADFSLGVPSDDDSVLLNLERNKVFDNVLIAKLREMKGFRNVLVHRYGTIDDELAYDVVKNNLVDFDVFKNAILSLLKSG